MSRKKEISAILIQALFRKSFNVSYFEAYHRERLWWYRATRILAANTQRLWRGFLARKLHRRLFERNFLPDPADVRNFDFWEGCQREADPPKAQVGIFAEFTLSGTPRSWYERRTKRNGFFRDVVFYANTIMKRASWTKPKGWISKDYQEYHVLRVQRFWRARNAKRRIRVLTKARRILDCARSQELANVGHDIAYLCNYALYAHAVLHNYDQARDLYTKMMDYMNHRGVDNAFVLYSSAIFGAVTNEEDWEDIKDYARRAKAADDRMNRRRGNTDAKCSYHIATAAFYLQTIICSEHPDNWHNYALCQMLVQHDLTGARESFIQAMNSSPQDKRIISNFNYLLRDPDFMGDRTRYAQGEYLYSMKNK